MSELKLNIRISKVIPYLLLIVLCLPVSIVVVAPFYQSDGLNVQTGIHGFMEGLKGFIFVFSGILMNTKGFGTEEFKPKAIGLAFLGMGLFSLAHGVSQIDNVGVVLYVMSMLIGGLFFTCSIIPPFNQFWNKNSQQFWWALIPMILIINWIILFPDSIPEFIDESGQFTSLARSLSVLAAVLYGLSIIGVIWGSRKRWSMVTIFIVVILLSFLISSATFSSSNPWESEWWTWHLMNICSAAIVFISTVILYSALIRERNSLLEKNNFSMEIVAKSEKRYRMIFENLIMGYARHQVLRDDNGKVCDYIYLEVNQAFEEFTGLNRLDIIGKRVTEIILGIKNDEADWIGKFGQVAESGEIIKYEDYAEGLNKWYQVTAYSTEKDYFTTLFTDITSRKAELEELRIAKERAEENDKLKSSFLANISHEIRTPMNGIIGFTELLKEPDLTKEEVHQYVDVIDKSAERMLSTITDIVDISLIEAGQIRTNITQVNIKSICQSVVDLVQLDAQKKGLELQLDLDGITPGLEIKTDEHMLFGILSNLVKNGIKYTLEGWVSVEVTRQDDAILFSVADSGIGIPKDQAERVFERFRQIDMSTTRQYEGMGLGLAICKSYTEILGGRIWLDPSHHKGSTKFHLEIPY